jgi:hypothetical protein
MTRHKNFSFIIMGMNSHCLSGNSIIKLQFSFTLLPPPTGLCYLGSSIVLVRTNDNIKRLVSLPIKSPLGLYPLTPFGQHVLRRH